MTPEERASRELAEELGFEIYATGNIEGTRHHVKKGLPNPNILKVATDEEWKLWSLCVRQRVRLNEVDK